MRNKAKSKKRPMMIIRVIKSPTKILSKIRDFYVQSITNCTGRISYGGAMACSTGPSSSAALPRNFSAHSSRESATADEDLRELIRAVTQKGLIKDHRINMADRIQQLQQQIKQQQEASEKGGVSIETIDENVSCHFDAEIR